MTDLIHDHTAEIAAAMATRAELRALCGRNETAESALLRARRSATEHHVCTLRETEPSPFKAVGHALDGLFFGRSA